MTSEQTFIAIKPDGVQVHAPRPNKRTSGLTRPNSVASSARSSAASSGEGTYHLPPHTTPTGPTNTALTSYKLAAIKLVTPTKEHLEKHYEDLSDKPFFKGLITCTPIPPHSPWGKSYPARWRACTDKLGG
ncbi:nucleoside diphosphate kinase Ndk1 [Friedmanniomyces endolithicus]|uniref:Nucleoside diphosphate kinase n=1 Tax=Friedmanniomyces endolithicus TaxID=329885 RepID=A0AAN6QVR5_9PEZI|nr:nucleoside diphosphate kinase Ndk1 [Friedmanniomyces endolithicus]KAK0813819.1 nucleoside diphosphate kinase Ndk1 [Friedmanniomyces endolithicus]KAK0815022.1 nucleoside diphosphate kinase Ndk1 [Friedmanniomyces endolithicus]KAK0852005.1 nucleoside diphosphate kinase Ndk1 [Friedmanniomyces endolithicus]KAK0869758.1 nucleoside diphosphate kinase Ndk1 [Friedmanniomyces endolithicus]